MYPLRIIKSSSSVFYSRLWMAKYARTWMRLVCHGQCTWLFPICGQVVHRNNGAFLSWDPQTDVRNDVQTSCSDKTFLSKLNRFFPRPSGEDQARSTLLKMRCCHCQGYETKSNHLLRLHLMDNWLNFEKTDLISPWFVPSLFIEDIISHIMRIKN